MRLVVQIVFSFLAPIRLEGESSQLSVHDALPESSRANLSDATETLVVLEDAGAGFDSMNFNEIWAGKAAHDEPQRQGGATIGQEVTKHRH